MRSVVVCLVLFAVASPAVAQDPQQAQQPQSPPPAQDDTIDPTKLGVSLKKIQRGLFVEAARDKERRDGLHLEFNVQVYGMAPKIEVLKGIDLSNGQVPGTAPSHDQMIEYWTPQIYRTPALPVSALAYWVGQHMWEKSKKSRCEEEIANYRAMIMQGMNVSAPRCTQ
jgi:hypothetical protein